jgi:hypothetical protein
MNPSRGRAGAPAGRYYDGYQARAGAALAGLTGRRAQEVGGDDPGS